MTKYVGAVDQGTTSTRFMIFDHEGKVVGIDQKEHEQIYPKPGWVEHNPMEIWERCKEVMNGALAKYNVKLEDLAAIGVTNQRETTVVWEKATGKPVYNAIVWQDTRTDTICNDLAKDGGQDRFRAKVGLPLATYFSGPKIKWILDNVPGVRAKAEKGEVLVRQYRHVGDLESDGRPQRRRACDRRVQCQPHHVDESGDAGLGSGYAQGDGHSARHAARRQGVQRSVWLRSVVSPWRATWATSRRRCSGRPASAPARPRTPMAPAASCC